MTLAEYVLALVAATASAEPFSAARLRRIVGARSAVIAVGDEAVLVRFLGEQLSAEPLVPGAPYPVADGVGKTDRLTVLDLLAGRIEATNAVLAGRLHLAGTVGAIVRIAQAIEILIDVSVRAPPLQALTKRYVGETARTAAATFGMSYERRRREASTQLERALLDRLDLLPNDPGTQ